MSFNAAALAVMAELGLTLQDVIKIARANDARSKAAERQARYRVRKTKRDATSDATSAPKEDTSNPPEVLSEAKASTRTVCADRYHRLPENWSPIRALPPKSQAKVDQWPPGALEAELEALHRWAANASNERGKGRKLDWDKAWVNWIERRHDEHYGKGLNGGRKPSAWLAARDRNRVRSEAEGQFLLEQQPSIGRAAAGAS